MGTNMSKGTRRRELNRKITKLQIRLQEALHAGNDDIAKDIRKEMLAMNQALSQLDKGNVKIKLSDLDKSLFKKPKISPSERMSILLEKALFLNPTSLPNSIPSPSQWTAKT